MKTFLVYEDGSGRFFKAPSLQVARSRHRNARVIEPGEEDVVWARSVGLDVPPDVMVNLESSRADWDVNFFVIPTRGRESRVHITYKNLPICRTRVSPLHEAQYVGPYPLAAEHVTCKACLARAQRREK